MSPGRRPQAFRSRNLVRYMAGILAGGFLVTAALQLGSGAIPDRARYGLHVALLVLAIAMLLESLSGRQRQLRSHGGNWRLGFLAPVTKAGFWHTAHWLALPFPSDFRTMFPSLLVR